MLRIVAILAVLAIAGPAFAADIPVKAPPRPPAVYDWTGFYIGAHAGYLWGRARVVENGVVTDPSAPIRGFIGGGMAGMNWQKDALVWGLEADVGFTNAHGTGTGGAPPPATPNLYDINWTSHLRGRFGLASDNVLFFIAGGLAIADFKFTQGDDGGVLSGAKFVGGSIGVGAEYGFTRDITGRVEYLYDYFGSKTYVIGVDTYNVRLTGGTLRGALTVKLWDGH
jgi:outer membrane immunogenic protein